MAQLAGQPLRDAEPRLAGLDRLVTRWMNGIMYYLDRDVPFVHGHAIYIDSAWALTSISQRQFWKGYDLEAHGDGRVRASCPSTSPSGTAPARGWERSPCAAPPRRSPRRSSPS